MKRRTLKQFDAIKVKLLNNLIDELRGKNNDIRVESLGKRLAIASRKWNTQMNHFNQCNFNVNMANPNANQIRLKMWKYL